MTKPQITSDLIDFNRVADLCDVGGNGLIAAIAVGSDGWEYAVVASMAHLGDPSAHVNANTPEAPHEQLGPLPPELALRVKRARFRCGRTTTTGTRCRVAVDRPDFACRHHGAALVTNDRPTADRCPGCTTASLLHECYPGCATKWRTE